jgi:hypothetical protein
MQWSTEQSYPPERWQSENITAQSTGWQIARSASSLERDEVAGAHRPAKPHPRRPGASLLSDRTVTPSRPLPLRRNAGVMVQQGPLRRCDAATERLQHRFSLCGRDRRPYR